MQITNANEQRSAHGVTYEGSNLYWNGTTELALQL